MFHLKLSIMSKKFTSFLIFAVALLLSLPAQAQNSNSDLTQKRKAVVSSATIKNPKKLTIQQKDAKVAAQAAQAKAEEKTISPEEQQYLLDKAAKEASASETVPVINWASLTPNHYVSKSNLFNDPVKPAKFTLPAKNAKKNSTVQSISNAFNLAIAKTNKAPRKAETVDEHGIITEPAEGETKYYTRSGTAYYYSNSSVYTADQSGTVTIVETSDGTVYIKDPVTRFAQGSWVKGTKEGNTITVAGAQPLYYVSNYDATLSLNWGTSSDNSYARGTGDITFTIDGNTISLEGSSESNIIGVFWDDDNTWQGYGDYETVWTLDEGYTPPSTDLVVLPEGATVQTWYRDQVNASSSGETAVSGTDVSVAFVDNEVYISGIFEDFPESWIKGTLDGTTVTFESGQFIGKYSSYDIWAYGTDGDGLVDAFTMTYDATAQTLTADNQLLANAAEDRIYYLQWISALTLYAEEPAPAQIDELPYSNGFDDASLQKHFTVIDANGDGKTWTASNGEFAISYASPNNDDWLVSPAIMLVAGKKYHFAIDSRIQSSNYPETFEVKAAKEATADALSAGTEVLAQQTISNATYSTYETEGFSVTETGYYYIGIHNISPDMFKQYVDNFLIEAAPISAPYTADFTQEGFIEDFGVIDNNNDGSTWSWSSSNYAFYRYNSSNPADDYLVLPIKLEAGKSYNVIVEAAANSTTWSEKFEVVAGTAGTVDALTTTVIEEKTVGHTDFQEYEGSYTPEADGTYYIAIHATSDPDMFYLKVKTFTVEVAAEGNAPAAVENFTVVPFTDEIGAAISFNAPTKAIDGTDLADGDITKIEILRDGNVINTIENPAPGSEQIYSDDASDLTIGNHTYQVIPYGASGIGEKSEEITVFLSGVLTVPYTADFTAASTIETFQIIDNNSDGSTWTWSSSYNANYSYNSANAADDYLVTSPVKLEAGKSYLVTVTARAYNASYPERFEVVVGKEATVAGLSQTVIAATDVTSTEANDFESEFSVSESGNYYVAIHAISDANMWRLIVDKFSIEVGAEPTAPAAAELTGTPGAEGALEAILSFTAPANAVNGSALSGTEDIKIYRDDVLVNTLTGVAPGSAQTWTDTNVQDGSTYTYYIVAANESGDGQKSNKVSVFVGQDTPADITGFQKTADTATSLTFAWDEVAGVNGGYVNAAAAEYTVYSMAIESNGLFSYLVVDQALGSVTGETTATVDYDVDEGEQTYQYFGVSAKVGANETDPAGAYTYALVGAPYELPMTEGFTDKKLHYVWDYSENAYLGVSEDASDGDGAALAMSADGVAGIVTFFTGKVNLNPAANPTVIFDAMKGTSTVDALTVFVMSPDGTTTDVETVTLTDEYQTFKVKIPESAKNGRYNQIGFKAEFPTTGETVIIDNINIGDLYEYNLAVDLSAPKTVQAGNKVTVTAKVENIGEETIDSYNITIKAGEKELLNEDVNEPLAMFESKKFNADFETTIFDEAGDVTITATVTPEVDLDETDNTSDAVITVTLPTAAPPTNLNVTESENGDITLTWDAPTGSTEEVTEGFETDLGDFVSIDSDGDGFGWDVHINTGTGNHSTHNGDGSAYSASYDNDSGTALTPDNWLVVPAILNGTFKFWAVGQDPSYAAEHFAVYVSTTSGTDVSTFTQVSEEFVATGEYQEYSVDLSSYAGQSGWVAIRHFNVTDMFVLVIDDVTYLVGGGDVAGYNIYVDGELETSLDADGNVNGMPGINKAASSLTAVLAGLGQSLTNGEHEFAVTAVYASGAESKPEKFLLTTTTSGIESVSVDGKPVDIYSVDGKLIRKQATSLEGLKGLYIINNKKVIIQ